MARERELDLEHIGKRKAEQVQTSRGLAKNPRFFSLDRRVIRFGAIVASSEGCMTGFVERMVWDPISAASQGTSTWIALPPPPPPML